MSSLTPGVFYFFWGQSEAAASPGCGRSEAFKHLCPKRVLLVASRPAKQAWGTRLQEDARSSESDLAQTASIMEPMQAYMRAIEAQLAALRAARPAAGLCALGQRQGQGWEGRGRVCAAAAARAHHHCVPEQQQCRARGSQSGPASLAVKSMRGIPGRLRRLASFMQVMGRWMRSCCRAAALALCLCRCRLLGMAGECAVVAQVCCTRFSEQAELRCTHYVPARASRACMHVPTVPLHAVLRMSLHLHLCAMARVK